MKPHEFHAKFADTPLRDRYTIINVAMYGSLTLTQIYMSLKEYEDIIRPYEIKIQELMRAVDEYYIYVKQKKEKKGS